MELCCLPFVLEDKNEEVLQMKQREGARKRLDELPEFCSITDFSDVFRVSRATAYRMAAQGEIPCLHIGKRIILSREHLRQWVDKNMEVN